MDLLVKTPSQDYDDSYCIQYAKKLNAFIVTNDKFIYKTISRLKDQGRVGPTTGGEDNYVSVGYNFKFTNLQATLGLSQLASINQRVNREL